ncbi:hypothetical protein HPB48_022469 [Haemaphysalis longicornis]|uniref:Uncharacterized protein n=1 Tax=Haemaphysalis longicornis TaxID=44386 RepID=A0A9J6H1T7_HAELO|nr:hypothetical protein HPB48_022469 [Haemaphysalis longicornis]
MRSVSHCHLLATADPQPKPAQAPKNSTDKVVPTGQGGDPNGSAGGAVTPTQSLGRGSGGVAGVTSAGAVDDAVVGSGGVSTISSGGSGITVLGSGTRRLGNDAASAAEEQGKLRM